MGRGSCGTCRFYHEDEPNETNECRRRAPTVLLNHKDEGLLDTFWPDVDSNEWCGEYEPDGEYLADDTEIHLTEKGMRATDGGGTLRRLEEIQRACARVCAEQTPDGLTQCTAIPPSSVLRELASLGARLDKLEDPEVQVKENLAGVAAAAMREAFAKYVGQQDDVVLENLRGAGILIGALLGHRSRNSFEESLLRALRYLIPKEWDLPIVTLAHRGFGRTELARFCQHHVFSYLIRIKPDVMAQGSGVWAANAYNPTQYGYTSGTSFSCPLTAGAIALILKARPHATPMRDRRGREGHCEPGVDAGQPVRMGNHQRARSHRGISPSAAGDEPERPAGFALEQNYPNPFNPKTVIRFAVQGEERVRLTVHDPLGRQVAALLDRLAFSSGSATVGGCPPQCRPGPEPRPRGREGTEPGRARRCRTE